jgi:choline dehydrogenase-like flavoprotein
MLIFPFDGGGQVRGFRMGSSGKIPDRPADSNGVEAEVYLSSGMDNHPIDISLVLEQFPIATPEAEARFAAPPKEGFTIAPALVQPTSRGQVRLASADWRDAPVIEANHLGTDHDVNAIVGNRGGPRTGPSICVRSNTRGGGGSWPARGQPAGHD